MGKKQEAVKSKMCAIFNQNRSLVSENKIPHSFSLQQCKPIPSVEKVNIIFDNLSSDTCAIKYSKTSNVVLLNFASDKKTWWWICKWCKCARGDSM